jgi:hypothetical protein
MLFAEVSSCTWDAPQRTLTTNLELNKKMKAFKNASWFKDKFGLLNQARATQKKDYVAPEALYTLEGGGSFKSIHDCHRPAVEKAKAVLPKKLDSLAGSTSTAKTIPGTPHST